MELITDPEKIQNKSFEIIEEVLQGRELPEKKREIIYRIVHATADFDISEVTVFSENAVEEGRKALEKGARIITDVNMLRSGVSTSLSDDLGYSVECFIADEDVRSKAEEAGITRSMMAMRKAAEKTGESIYVIGNAPTALIELINLVRAERADPALIIGTPVGLVGAAEAKNELEKLAAPHITIRGKKGGTAAAAAAINALIYL